MAFDDPTAIDGLSLSSLEWRRGLSGLLAHTADSLSAMPGVLHGFSCTVASLTLTVAAGSAVITPSAGSNGSYIAVANAAETVTITAQDATYARIDRVVLRIWDTQVDGSGYSKAAVEIITGTPAASPVAPTLPTGRLEIAQLQVPKSGAGSITVVDKRLYAAPAGGTIVANSYSDLPTGSFLRVGQRAATLDGVTWRWAGSAWRVDGKPSFATAAARDTAIPAPAAGDQCWIVPASGDVQDWRYDGTYWWQADAPVTAILGVSFAIPAGTADVGMQVAVNSPGTSAVWEVALDLDAQVSSAAGSFFVATIVADGVTQGGQIIGSTIASHSGARQPFSKRWIVSGIAAGPGKIIKVQAAGGGSTGNWQLNSVHSALIVKRLK